MKNLFYFTFRYARYMHVPRILISTRKMKIPLLLIFMNLKLFLTRKSFSKPNPANMKQILGAGYDVTADHLSPEAIKAPIIDLEKLETAMKIISIV